MRTVPRGWKAFYTKSGWMNGETFAEWFEKCFVPFVNDKRSGNETAILLLDGHKSHESTQLLECAESNNIDIIMMPPNLTHLLQPMDVAVFKVCR